MPIIKQLDALEILDSRGKPTLKAYCTLGSGATGYASVPSGASTGQAEAHELRDGEERFNGNGCRKAVQNIKSLIHQELQGQEFQDQTALDKALLELDGTSNKSRLGANAVLGVSLAFARAVAREQAIPLYEYFSGMGELELRYLPRPTINLFSGGKHAGSQVPVQDLLVVPAFDNLSEVYQATYHLYQEAASYFSAKYGVRALSADEGGLAPPFQSQEDMFEDAIEVLRKTGYDNDSVSIALDVASSHFYQDGEYQIKDRKLNGDEMVEQLGKWFNEYPIISLEDGLSEEDWDHWTKLTQQIGSNCLIMGDDLLCTNPERIQKAIDLKAANALLLKVNQIGTLSEALNACKLARKAGWSVTISARSGETEDDWLADLAYGWQADFIKVGSITQSERLAKYNRLLEIEAVTSHEVIPHRQA